MKIPLGRSLVALAGLSLTQFVALAHADTTAANAAATPPAAKVSRITGVAADPDWEENYAYTLGVQAYTYAFPWFYNSFLRWKWTTQPASTPSTPSMPLNTFWHLRSLADASYRDGGMPNNDTLYSVAWVDVGKEPVILAHPEMGDRYFSFCLTGFDSDNFAYIGKRTTGSHAGTFAIVGPDWKGELPAGVKLAARSTSNVFFLLGRTLISGPADLSQVHHLQDQYTLTPLSLWGKKSVVPAEDRNVAPPFDRRNDPLADWKTINRAMTEIPPQARDAILIRQYASIGIGPGQDVDKMSDATKRGLIRALDTGKGILTGAASSGAGTIVGKSQWRLTPKEWGRFGAHGEHFLRSAMQSLQGIATNEQAEAFYPQLFRDANGELLSGIHRYRLHFAKRQLPPAREFWSLTAYGLDFNLIDNSINRYSLGDRSTGLKYDADGGLTIYLQKDSPGSAMEGNWLPTGDEGFALVLRLYLPDQEALALGWEPPAIERLD
jgi:hypothetical protein